MTSDENPVPDGIELHHIVTKRLVSAPVLLLAAASQSRRQAPSGLVVGAHGASGGVGLPGSSAAPLGEFPETVP